MVSAVLLVIGRNLDFPPQDLSFTETRCATADVLVLFAVACHFIAWFVERLC